MLSPSGTAVNGGLRSECQTRDEYLSHRSLLSVNLMAGAGQRLPIRLPRSSRRAALLGPCRGSGRAPCAHQRNQCCAHRQRPQTAHRAAPCRRFPPIPSAPALYRYRRHSTGGRWALTMRNPAAGTRRPHSAARAGGRRDPPRDHRQASLTRRDKNPRKLPGPEPRPAGLGNYRPPRAAACTTRRGAGAVMRNLPAHDQVVDEELLTESRKLLREGLPCTVPRALEAAHRFIPLSLDTDGDVAAIVFARRLPGAILAGTPAWRRGFSNGAAPNRSPDHGPRRPGARS